MGTAVLQGTATDFLRSQCTMIAPREGALICEWEDIFPPESDRYSNLLSEQLYRKYGQSITWRLESRIQPKNHTGGKNMTSSFE